MDILLLGANGFIGRHLEHALLQAGYRVRRGVHAGPARCRVRDVIVDYAKDQRVDDWVPRLSSVGAVINAVGILTESRDQRFEDIHVKAPQALFQACVQAGITKVIQISALGADEAATSQYHLSKKAADDFLASLDLNWVVVQPSLVYGCDGASSQMFRTIASLPLIPVPGEGMQALQPIYVDDLCACVVRLLDSSAPKRCRIPLVGPYPIAYRTLLGTYREKLGLPPGRFMNIPLSLLKFAAHVTRWFPGSALTPETLAMLERGNTADPAMTKRLLGQCPRPINSFLTPKGSAELRLKAQLGWLVPLLKFSIALLWIFSGVVSLGVYPIGDSLKLLAALGLQGATALFSLYGLAALDIALGLAVCFKPGRTLWATMFALVLFYSIGIAIFLPEYWLHPFMPVGKNLPILAILVLLYTLEKC